MLDCIDFKKINIIYLTLYEIKVLVPKSFTYQQVKIK